MIADLAREWIRLAWLNGTNQGRGLPPWFFVGLCLGIEHEIMWTTRTVSLWPECKLCLRLQAKPALRLLATCSRYFNSS